MNKDDSNVEKSNVHEGRFNVHGFFLVPRGAIRSEILPEDFEQRFAKHKSKWDKLRGIRMTQKEKCSSILIDYCQGWGWRHHRVECQKIHDELRAIENHSEIIQEFFCNKVNLYLDNDNYKQDGEFLQTLLFCRAVIEWEKTHPDINLFDYCLDLYCRIFRL